MDVETKQRIERTGFESVAERSQRASGRCDPQQCLLFRIVRGDDRRRSRHRMCSFLQDGLPIVARAASTAASSISINRTSGRLDRVEVVRGAASSLYGTDAIGGVIT